jgi:hypothetical protein
MAPGIMVRPLSAPHMLRTSPNCQLAILAFCSQKKILYMQILGSHASTIPTSCKLSFPLPSLGSPGLTTRGWVEDKDR